MATELAIVVSAKNQAKSVLEDVNTQLAQTEKSAGGANKALLAMGGAVAAIGAAAVGTMVVVGKMALDVQKDYDDAVDSLIIGTGASGEALDAMGQSVKNLKTGTAGLGTDMRTIGATMAELNTRTGATGEQLETLTGSIMDFSRLTGTDSVQNTRLLTRTMGDWGVSMEDGSALLDKMFGAGQAFGISIDSLAGKLVQFGAPLRQMGFSLEESMAMLGKWEKEGVNTELVIGSLRIAAGKFADQNIPLAEGLADVSDRIKNAATDSEALTIAMETFGARAGPDMAAAIREGRFSLEEAIATLDSTSGSLADATDRALDFGDRWEMTVAKVQVAMQPLGEAMWNLAEQAMPYVEQAMLALVEAGTVLLEWTISASTALGELISVFANYGIVVADAGASSSEASEALGLLPEWAQGAAVALVELQTVFEQWGAQAQAIGTQVMEFLAPAFANVQSAAGDMMAGFGELSPQLAELQEAFSKLWVAIQPIVEVIGVALVMAFDLLLNTVAAVMRALPQLVGNAILLISGMLTLMANNITNTIALIKAAIAGDWQQAWQLAQQIARDNFDFIEQAFRTLWSNITLIGASILTAIKNTFNDMLAYLTSLNLPNPFAGFKGVIDAVVTAIGKVQTMVNDLSGFLSGLSFPNPFAGWSFPEPPDWVKWLMGGGGGGSGGGTGNNAIGSQNWRGGMTMVGETGPELVMLPRGSRIFGAQETQRMAAAPAGVAVTVESMVVRSDMDIHEIAYRVADLLARG